jgi:small-conductance mechanosensitive channel
MLEEIKAALGLNVPSAGQTVTKTLQVLLIGLLTAWIAHRVSDRINRAAKAGRVYAEVATLVSRAAALAIYGIGLTIILAVLGASWTAIAAILGAATFGISLALQDVGRNFVNGIYLLIERPFRLGDWVRIGLAEGRVEEVGIRLTSLRNPASNRIIIPNSVVFSSIIENDSVGRMDHQRYTVDNVTMPITEIEAAVIASLDGTPHLSHRAPLVEYLQSGPEGTNIRVTVEHDLGHRIDDQVIDRLCTLFPEATVSTARIPAS